MDAKDLKVFQAVARTQGMNSAADVLHTVQSNVTARIRALEQELELKLFHRHSRGVTLTRAGERLLPYAKKIEVLLDEAKRAAADDGAPHGPLTIGSLDTTAAQRLPPIVTAFGTRFRDVNLVLRTGTNAVLIDEVLASELDGAFVCAPVKHPDLVAELAFREELVIAAAPGVKSLKQLLGASQLKILVKGPGCAYRSRLEELLARRGLTPTGVMEFGTLEAIVGCVEAVDAQPHPGPEALAGGLEAVQYEEGAAVAVRVEPQFAAVAGGAGLHGQGAVGGVGDPAAARGDGAEGEAVEVLLEESRVRGGCRGGGGGCGGGCREQRGQCG